MRTCLVVALVTLAACGSISQSPECKKYLACSEAVTPGSAAQYGTSYGEAGSCWSTTQAAADQCTAACVNGLQTLQSGLGANKAECK